MLESNAAQEAAEVRQPQVLTAIGRRVFAYVVDWVAVMTVLAVICWSVWALAISGQVVAIVSFFFDWKDLLLIILLALCANNLVVALEVWLFNGYTLGKWMVRARVVRRDGARITLGTALLRELVIKGICSNITQGIINVVSFVWAVSTPENKTLHDLACGTMVLAVYGQDDC